MKQEETKIHAIDRLFANKAFRYFIVGIGLFGGVILGYANLLNNRRAMEITLVVIVIAYSPILVLYLVRLWQIDRARLRQYKEEKKRMKESGK